MAPSRRVFLTGALTSLTGCSTFGQQSPTTSTPHPDSDGDGVPDAGDQFPNNPEYYTVSSSWQTTSEDLATLAPGEYSAHYLHGNTGDDNRHLHYELTVHGAHPVDCLFIDRDEWDPFVDGNRDVPIRDDLSVLDTTQTSFTVPIPPEPCLFVLDYTKQGTPPGEVPIDIEQLGQVLLKSTT
ncbi:hypothetical protein [Halomarina rubra]|uniref:Uncharacterized protein n=1 Tax=Halomarina rubra TaxID=2071873 RepID=A0ABD6ASN2_9EURY|nr:hypothetical protein [Halomarina rubra]